MIKPQRLKVGDTVAIVSPSSGMAGETIFLHRFNQGIERLKTVFGLKVKLMPNTLKGSKYVYNHPEKRAEDLMNAFKDPEVKAIICTIGGDDSIRLVPYIDYEVIKNNPKIFMGYSDITAIHLMMYKAGVVSFHGPCIMVEFAENVEMHDYTKYYIENVLFNPLSKLEIKSSPYWTSELLDWVDIENNNIQRKLKKEQHGFEVLNGNGVVSGKLFGGCLSVLQMAIGTSIWPDLKDWDGKVLFLETAEDFPTPDHLKFFLRNLNAQGILDRINGMIIGKPLDEKYYDEYKHVYLEIINEIENKSLPILYNINCSHTSPICIMPYGIEIKIDCDNKTLTLKENAVI